MGLSALYKRWRHTRGFGVHSPMGYRMVRLAYAPSRRYAWYGYQDIDEDISGLGGRRWVRARSEARMLLRHLAFLKIKDVYIGAGALQCPGISAAITAAGATAHDAGKVSAQVAQKGDVMLLGVGDDALSQVCDMMADGIVPGIAIMLTGMSAKATAEASDRLYAMMDSGVMLEGRHRLIAVMREGMPPYRYTML